MITDQDIWEKACERVGVERHFDPDLPYGTNRYVFRSIGDAEAVVKMLEWLGDRYQMMYWYAPVGKFWVVRRYNWETTYEAPTLPLALAHSVCAIEEK